MFDYVLYCIVYGVGRVEFEATAPNVEAATVDFKAYLREIFPGRNVLIVEGIGSVNEGASAYPRLV